MDVYGSSLRLTLAHISNAIIGFLGIAYFAQKLGSGGLGTYFLFQTSVGLLSLLTDFGVKGALEKRISGSSRESQYISTAAIMNGAFLVFVSLGILLARGELNRYLGADLAVFVIVALTAREAGQFMINILNGELRVGETASMLAVQQVVWVAGGAVLYEFGYDVRALVYSYIISYIVVFLIGIAKRRTPFGQVSRECVQSLLDYSKYHFISMSGSQIYNWMDIAIIGFFLTQSHVGAYESAWRVAGMVLLVSNAISKSIFPQISQWDTEGDIESIEELISNSLAWSLIFVVPGFFGVVLFSKPILRYLFGAEFTIASGVLVIFLADKIVGAVQVVIGRSLSAIDHPELSARASLISVALNLVLNILLIWQFGILGAAVATFVSSSIGDGLHAFYLSRFIDLRFPVRRVAWIVASSIVMFLVVSGITRTIVPVESRITLTFGIITGVIVYLAVILLSQRFRRDICSHIRSKLAA